MFLGAPIRFALIKCHPRLLVKKDAERYSSQFHKVLHHASKVSSNKPLSPEGTASLLGESESKSSFGATYLGHSNLLAMPGLRLEYRAANNKLSS